MGLQLGLRCLRSQAVACAKILNLAVLDELVRPADANHWNADSQLAECLQDGRSEAARLDVVFKGNEGRNPAGVMLDEFKIERLDEAWIDDSGRDAVGFEARSEVFCQGNHGVRGQRWQHRFRCRAGAR